jgi:glycosyltransferase involved in cell wall biosynthesis
MTCPTFSVIIPVYNAARTLDACVRSVLAQSHTDFDLILIDDGSTDASRAIMLDLAGQDDRIRVVSQCNAGVAATRNLGVSLSAGDLIAFLDADDLWHPEKLARHLAYHRADPDVGVSYAKIAFIGDESASQMPRRTTSSIMRGGLTIQDILSENPVCTMSNLVVTRRCFDAVGPFLADMSFAEDQEWLARAVDHGFIAEGLDEVLVDYRLSHDGLSVNLERMYDGWRRLAQMYRQPADLRSAEAIYCRYLARRALRSGARPVQALAWVVKGLRLDADAFLADARRGWMTLLSACIAPFLPRAARLRFFA